MITRGHSDSLVDEKLIYRGKKNRRKCEQVNKLLHRKVETVQHRPHKKPGLNYCTPERYKRLDCLIVQFLSKIKLADITIVEKRTALLLQQFVHTRDHFRHK